MTKSIEIMKTNHYLITYISPDSSNLLHKMIAWKGDVFDFVRSLPGSIVMWHDSISESEYEEFTRQNKDE